MKDKIAQLKKRIRRLAQRTTSSSCGLHATRHWLVVLAAATLVFVGLVGVSGSLYYTVQNEARANQHTVGTERLPLNMRTLESVTQAYAERCAVFDSLRAVVPAMPDPVVADEDESASVDAAPGVSGVGDEGGVLTPPSI